MKNIIRLKFSFNVYIPQRKYHVKPHSSSWFSSACAADIVHRNHFFHLCQQNKSFESKLKFRQATNCYKMVLEAAKVPYANETKESITFHPRNLALGIFAKLPIVFSTKLDVLCLLFNSMGVL